MGFIDKIRDNLYNRFTSSDLTKEEFSDLYSYQVLEFLKLENANKAEVCFFLLEILAGYSDFYKITNYKVKENMVEQPEYYYVSFLKEIKKEDDILDTVINYPGFLSKLYESMITFYELSYLGRCNLYFYLEKDDLQDKIDFLFQNKNEAYLKEITLEDYRAHLEEEYEIANENGCEEESFQIDMIASFIKKLSLYRSYNAKKNIKDLLIFYYQWMKYLKDHNLPIYDINGCDFITFFESNSILDLEEAIIKEEGAIKQLLQFYFMYDIEDEIILENETMITTKEVLDYSKENVKEKIRREYYGKNESKN